MTRTFFSSRIVTGIPRYILFNKFSWIDSYLPFYIPDLFGCYPFFIYQMVQFMRGIPKDLDEAAYIDGCGAFRTLIVILMPLLKPAMFSAGLLQFTWTYNDYLYGRESVASTFPSHLFSVSFGLKVNTRHKKKRRKSAGS